MLIMVFFNKVFLSVVITAVINCGYCAESFSNDEGVDCCAPHEDKSSSNEVGDEIHDTSIEFWRLSDPEKDGSYYRVSRAQVEKYFRLNIGKYEVDLTGSNHVSLCIQLIKDFPDLRGDILDEIDAYTGSSHLMYACVFGDKEGVKLLIQRGANVNKPSSSGVTPLLAACQRNNTEIVDLLLNAGASPNCEIESPIMVACEKIMLSEGNFGMVLSLFRHGADLFKRNYYVKKGDHARSAFSCLTDDNREIFFSLLTSEEKEKLMPAYVAFQSEEIAFQKAMEKLHAEAR